MRPNLGPPPRKAAAEAALAGVTPALKVSASEARNRATPAALQQRPDLRVLDGGRVAWSSQQLDAIDAIETWLGKGDRPFFYLAGYAGTGKTTIQRRIADVAGDDVLFAAFTGKAASVMARNGCAGATTIDRLLYTHPFTWRRTRDCGAAPCAELCRHARQEFQPRQLDPGSEVAGADLVIIDEVSMVAAPMAHDLLSFGTPVLVIGDPGQLPPIAGAGYFTQREPDAFLSEIHRQAAGDPIIALATMARSGREPAPGKYGESAVVQASSFDRDLTKYDAVICGKNTTRRWFNAEIRKQLGFTSPLPSVGEKLVVLRNRHAKGRMNGEVVTVAGVDHGHHQHGFLRMIVAADSGDPVEIDAPVDLLLADDHDARGAQGDPLTWGYALTVHKAQGSQWGSVLLFDESIYFRENRWRWLYTGITRASDSISLVVRG